MRFECRIRNVECGIIAAAIGGVLVCSHAIADEAAPAERLRKLCDDYWQFRMRTNPEWATYLGDHRYNDKITDYSESARLVSIKTYQEFARRLKELERYSLSPDDQLNAEMLEWTVTEALDLAPFPEHLMPIKQQESPQIVLGLIQVTHPFKTPADCKNYAARQKAFKTQVRDMVAAMEMGRRDGVVRPKITIEQALPQIEAMISVSPRTCVLYEPALKLPPTAGGESSQAAIAAGVTEAIEALRSLRDYLRGTYLPACRDTVGYCHLPHGKAWYRRLAKHHTTTELTPEALHRIGLKELRQIHADMRKVAAEVGFAGDLQGFIAKIRKDPAQHNKSAEEILKRHAATLKRSDALLPTLFGRLPRIPYELKEMESFRAPAAPEGYYYNAPDDGSRPAYFCVNTHEPQSRPIYTMEALAYHEAQPGHHFQIALAQEKKDRPMFRRFESINAFIEGWALYSERLGYQLGGYRDPYSRFGRLTFDAWRSSRLVVDTGMHYMGWTRDQAIDFMKENTALSEKDIVSEVDRYIAWPGQALAYKVGEIEILRLRREAEDALGASFDIRAFHDELLAEGSVPLSTLSKRMNAWTKGRK